MVFVYIYACASALCVVVPNLFVRLLCIYVCRSLPLWSLCVSDGVLCQDTTVLLADALLRCECDRLCLSGCLGLDECVFA